jgi:hypothetical protein
MSLRSTVLLSVLALSSRVDAQCGPPLTQELLPPDPQTNTTFGRSIAVSGDTLVVGNEQADNNVGGSGFRGAVYVWRRNGSSYAFEAKLPGFAPTSTYMGSAVDIDGEVLIASQFGSSYPVESARVFRRMGGVWTYEAQLQPSDPLTTNATQIRSLAIDGDWVAVAHRTALGANGWPSGFTGAVYLYEHSAGVWTQRAKVVPVDAVNGDSTGWSVAMDGGVLAFSSRAGGFSNAAPAGRVHVHRIVAGAPVAEATLTASVPGQLGNDFGHAIATDGVRIAVSDPNDNAVGGSTGCVYVYGHSAGAWVELAVVRPSLPAAAGFGAQVRIEGDELYVSSAVTKGVWHFRRLPTGEWAELGVSSVPTLTSWKVDSFDVDGGQLVVGARSVYSSSGAAYAFDTASTAVCTYCTAKTTSGGCVPAIGWSGATSLSGADFTIHANSLLPNKSGLFFYGAHGAAVAFQGGTLCVATPLTRTPLTHSGGAAACTGSSSLDFSAWIAGGFDPRLVAGTRWAAQYWSRDPQASYATNLTDTLVFTLLP